ncbi:LOW QUALITY PROTEIN: NLR family CARD domain-containing protein 3-like [Polymixia lowei]
MQWENAGYTAKIKGRRRVPHSRFDDAYGIGLLARREEKWWDLRQWSGRKGDILRPGKTTRKLKQRISEHKSSIRRNDREYPVAVHFNDKKHDISSLRFFGIEQSNLKEKFQCLFEGIAKPGKSTLLNEIYTELYITEGESGEVNDEHEVRQIETASRKPVTPETSIKCQDIFKPLPGQVKPIRTLITKGVAGIGKTVLTQKFTLDWAESHIKTSRSLHIMCHIPVFCWITATVLEHVLRTDERGEMPKTLTEVYIHFLVVQSIQGNVKYHGRAETDPHCNRESREIILSLGKLAFKQLEKSNLIFYEADLVECGIDIRAASVYSGVFTQIFKEERGLYQDMVFCFVHLSIQEFLAAVYVFVSFISTGVNPFTETQSTSWWSRLSNKLQHLHQRAVDKALQSRNGHLDLFLRFLLGLSLETNQTLLRGLQLTDNQETVQYIKKKIMENPSPERSINLFHCLNELKDHSLVEEIQQYLTSGHLSTDRLSPVQCASATRPERSF